MEWKLEPEEMRILGALMEKQMATPDYYPLSMNALVQACNQKSSRDPVVSYSEDLVRRHVTNLYKKGLVSSITANDRRVVRYDQRLSKLYNCSPSETAILCILMLRGPQTPGEIKGRTGRLYDFESLTDVLETLDAMMKREESPFVTQLARLPGRKENRFIHRFGSDDGEVPGSESIEVETREAKQVESDLRSEVAQLRKELQDLNDAFQAFKNQF